MKFYTAAASVAAMAGIAFAAPTDTGSSFNTDGIPFTLEARGGGYDGNRISLLHEGAGLSWAFINGVNDGFQIDPETKGLVSTRIPEIGGSKWYGKFDEAETALTFTPGGAQGDFEVSADGKLLYNGSGTFYACSNLEGNLYNYDAQAVALEPKGTCEEIEIVAQVAPAN